MNIAIDNKTYDSETNITLESASSVTNT
jgi:hypothetical protein